MITMQSILYLDAIRNFLEKLQIFFSYLCGQNKTSEYNETLHTIPSALLFPTRGIAI